MIQALTWVKSNIEFFGGNHDAVTISGQSSGGFMASWLTTIPQSWPLFSKIIQLEGPLTAVGQAFVYSKVDANTLGQQFTKTVGCNLPGNPEKVVDCLASADLKTQIDAWEPLGLWLPVVDNDLFKQNPNVAISSKVDQTLVSRIPSLMIAVPTPGTYFAEPFVQLILNNGGWRTYLVNNYGAQVGGLIADQYSDAVYGPPNHDSIFQRVQNFIGDSIWLCPLRRHANLMSRFAPVYVAMWNHQASFITSPPIYEIIHGTEIPFIFGNAVDVITDTKSTFNAKEAGLSNSIISVISNFVYYGTPGIPYPLWNPSTLELHTVIDYVLTEPDLLTEIRKPPAVTLNGGNRCDLWDSFFSQSLNLNIWLK